MRLSSDQAAKVIKRIQRDGQKMKQLKNIDLKVLQTFSNTVPVAVSGVIAV